mgnify:CR=1 FL=1
MFVGKTNLHEFAFGTTNEDSAFGPARNPHDPSRSPGGSSGGSAASVAAGMALATLGTDTGGSIRIPAAACGIVGLKPSLGEVSTEGIVPLSRTFDHAGPLAQTACGRLPRLSRAAWRRRPRCRRRRCRSGHAAGACRAATSAICWTTRCARASKKRSNRLRDAGAHVADVDLRHAGDHRRDLPAHRAGGRGRIPRGHAGDDARSVHAARAAAAGNGRDTCSRKTTCGRSPDATSFAARWTRRSPSTTRSCCRRCRFRRRSIGATTVKVGTASRAGAERHAPAHTALQRHGPPGDLIARRRTRRPGCRAVSSSSGAAAQTDALLRVALGCERHAMSGSSPRSGTPSAAEYPAAGRRRNVRWRHRLDVRRRLVDRVRRTMNVRHRWLLHHESKHCNIAAYPSG